MFKKKKLTVAEIATIDRAMEDVNQMALSNALLSYKLGRLKFSTEKIRQNFEKAQQGVFKTLGETLEDGRIQVKPEKQDELEKQLKALGEQQEEVEIPVLTITELAKCGAYFKPSFYQALGQYISVEEPSEEK